MSDIQLAVLLAALAGLGWYLRGRLERESGRSGVLESPAVAAPADRAARGLRLLLWGHFFSLLACIPILARSPFSLDEGHSMGRWLSDYLSAWSSWAGLLQSVYLLPLWLRLRRSGRPAAAKGLALAGGLTAGASLLAWTLAWNRPGAPLSLQAASGILALAAVVAMFWCGRELRASLRGRPQTG